MQTKNILFADKPLSMCTVCRHNADMTEKETARQTLTGIIRSRASQYQARQLAGVTQRTFAEELTAEGHKISYADFRTLYARARKQLARLDQPAQPKAASPHQPQLQGVESSNPPPTPKSPSPTNEPEKRKFGKFDLPIPKTFKHNPSGTDQS